MPKGVKKIKLSTGERYYKGQTTDKVIVVTGQVYHSFEVEEWFPGTTDAQKKDVIWLYEDVDRKTVLLASKTGEPVLETLFIPRKLCGNVPVYYLEASITGLIDRTTNSGLLIRGQCEPKIVKTQWSASYKGPSLGHTPIKFGQDVHLHADTEGLNAHKLTVEVYHRQMGSNTFIARMSGVGCQNGEINLLIRDTFNWKAKHMFWTSTAELYIMIIDEHSGKYVLDDKKQDIHGRFLRVENEVVTDATAAPVNLTVAKAGPPLENLVQVDHCKFTKLEIIEDGLPIPLFDEGKISIQGKMDKEFFLDEKINYEFDAYEVRNEDKKNLNRIAEILMQWPFIPVELGSHTDRFGTDEYNNKLSEKRAKAAVAYLVSRNIDPSRISAKGYGKSKLLNNDPNLTKKDSAVNRRTTLKLKIIAHNAASIEFQTIGPGKSAGRTLPIKISKFKTDGVCNYPTHPHHRNVPYGEITPKKKDKPLILDGNETINPVIYSPLDDRAHAYDYIWPMARSANGFFFYINSCRYFSDLDKYSLLVKVYSDIKWTLEFHLNLTNDLSVKWQNFSPAEHKEMQRKAGKIGAERRWEQKEASFGFSLKSEWNFKGTAPGSHDEFKKEHEGKFKKIYDLFSSFGAIADGITNMTKGTVRNIGVTNTPVSFVVKPPNLALTATWKLQRAKKGNAPIAKLGTRIDIGFHAQPLIGLEMTVDLIGAFVGLAAGAISGGSAAPGAVRLYNLIKDKLKVGLKLGNDDVGFRANVDVYMDLIISSTIMTDVGFGFNTVSTTKEDTFKLELDNKLGVELKAGVMIKGELSVLVVKVDGYFEAKASASASVTFGHGLFYDSKGLYYKPKLGFDGMNAEYVITASVGLAVKKGVPMADVVKDQKGDWLIAKGTYENIVPKFDVVESLEQLTGISIQVPLMKGDD